MAKEYEYQRRKPRTPGGRLAKHIAEVFTRELERRKLTKNAFYRRHATLVSAPTFCRLLDGKSGANVCLVADVADALGYELKLVPKTESEYEDEIED